VIRTAEGGGVPLLGGVSTAEIVGCLFFHGRRENGDEGATKHGKRTLWNFLPAKEGSPAWAHHKGKVRRRCSMKQNKTRGPNGDV